MQEPVNLCNNPELENRFGPYRKPNNDTFPLYELIQKKCLELAYAIENSCPQSREKSVALTELQGVKMWANAAIALNTKSN